VPDPQKEVPDPKTEVADLGCWDAAEFNPCLCECEIKVALYWVTLGFGLNAALN